MNSFAKQKAALKMTLRNNEIIPVILSGGSGTRLWPLSTEARPKQFLSFVGQRSLIEETLTRCEGTGFDPRPIIIGASAHRFLLAEAAQHCGIKADILLEPARRDSCAAIVAGALQAVSRNPDALVLVLAADHMIPDHAAFRQAAVTAATAAAAGKIVTFGVVPTSPATGYGYILPGADSQFKGCFALSQFVEKPNLATAERYLKEGYLWNSGNFLFKAATFLAEATEFVPEVYDAVKQSLTDSVRDEDFIRIEETAFSRSPRISVDFAIMEKTKKAEVFPVDYAWSDIGSWDSVAAMATTDDSGNAIIGRGHAEDGRNIYIHSQGKLTTVVGVNDITVITTDDAVLVIGRGHSEKVKALAAKVEQGQI
jgi:mannose-1-phosphate guanylyltransferase / mannose-6-phosphate isomerase